MVGSTTGILYWRSVFYHLDIPMKSKNFKKGLILCMLHLPARIYVYYVGSVPKEARRKHRSFGTGLNMLVSCHAGAEN